jgi:hypothetical protein
MSLNSVSTPTDHNVNLLSPPKKKFFPFRPSECDNIGYSLGGIAAWIHSKLDEWIIQSGQSKAKAEKEIEQLNHRATVRQANQSSAPSTPCYRA